jgi:hypothetical protein
MAVLMKQPGVWFPIGAALYLIYERKMNRKQNALRIIQELLVLAAGTLLPLVLTGLYLWRAGAFDRFWFWTIQYAREHGSLLSAAQAMAVFKHQIQSVVGVNWPLWGIAASGLFACMWRVEGRSRLPFLLFFSGAAFLAVCTGFYFREHYFILVLPAVSLFAAAAVTIFMERTQRVLQVVAMLLFGAALAYPMFEARDVLFRLAPIDACRAIYYPNPFAESLPIAEFVRKRTDPADQIAVLGSEPQICFYADRRSATGYIHTYGLMEPLPHASRMQREMIAEIERARPKLIILVAINESWIPQPNCDRTIFQWANDYCRVNYTPIGVVRFPEEGAVFDFSTDPSLRDLVRDYILIYERKI